MTDVVTAQWREVYLGGSQAAEADLFRKLAADMCEIQTRTAASVQGAPERTLHAKILVGVTNARLIVDEDLPDRFVWGYFQPGAERRAVVRLSNASSLHQSDAKPDLQGAALKVITDPGVPHDLLMTSYPVSHARDAVQFVTVAQISSGPKDQMLARLSEAIGVEETKRVLANVTAASRVLDSLAKQSFWSRAPLLWGPAGPLRYILKPLDALAPDEVTDSDPGRLTSDFNARLRGGEVIYRLYLQPFVDEMCTPIEDGAVEWKESDSSLRPVARLVIPSQDLDSPRGLSMRETVDRLAFNPWNCPPGFRPLGNLNRARRVVYTASATAWRAEDPAPTL